MTDDTLKLAGLIGDPVAHSRSPRLHNAAFARLGLHAHYELWPTAAAELPARVASLRAAHVLGANVTLPHKIAVIDLLDRLEPAAAAIGALPKTPNIVFMAGRKFGAEGDLALTWAMNSYVPALVAQAFAGSRIVAFSTGCVYPFVPVDSGGSREEMQPNPPGEYAQSCVGRERMFEYFSKKFSTPGRLFRLNYAIDMRYGVLYDIASKVLQGKPIDVSLGHVNFIWQGDASSQALRCLAHCNTPTSPINVSGHEILAVRDLAAKFGKRFGREPVLVGNEEPTAWLTNTSQAVKLFGLPVVDTEQLIKWTADWVQRDMPSLGKPTKYEVRDGRY